MPCRHVQVQQHVRQQLDKKSGCHGATSTDDIGKRLLVRVGFDDQLSLPENRDSVPTGAVATEGGTLKNTAPTLVSIERHTPRTSPTNADSLTWRVTFSDATRQFRSARVADLRRRLAHLLGHANGRGRGEGAVKVTASDGNGGSVSAAPGAGCVLMRCIAEALAFPAGIVPASTSAFARRTALAIAVVMGGSALPLLPVVWGGGDALAQEARAQAQTASISSFPSSGSTYRAGETVTLRLTMNEDVLVTGRPYIVLDVGGVRRRAVYAGPIGSSTDVLDFSYTVQAGDLDTDGVGLCGAGRRPGCGSIDLNGGSIRAAGDESAARLGHPALAAQSGHKVDAAPLPALSTACADEIRVRTDWALKPSSVSAGGTFRLLFVGSVDRNAQSSNIADYNRFVQSLAAAGHSSIRPFKGGFRAVGSTAAVDARDNTCTTGTGVPIHWLNGNQVADNYADFYDNSWDDQANPKTESGNAIGPRNVWTGSNSDGTNGGQPLGNTPGGGRLIRRGTIGQSGGGGSPLSAASALASSSGSALAFYGLSQVFKVPAASDKARTTDIAIISSPAIGDAYRLGETVEVEVMYSEAVTVRGAPLVGLSVKNATGNDDNEYDAAYVRGSGTTKLVFSFTVPSGLRDDDGIQLYSSPLRLNGATITAVSDGDPAVWNLAAERNIGGKVDSSRTPSGGICSRTPQVRDAIVAAVAAASDCSQVTNAYLTALTGTLEFSGLTSIAAGDLAGLSSLTRLNLYGSGIETLPVGLFDGLGSLTRLDVRVGLTHLPKDIFRGLGKVIFLSLDGLEYPESPGNQLREGGLPDGIFEPLSREVKSFWIFGSPGSESFRPRAADAGPGGTLSAGQKVTLGGPGNDGGPWGSNVFYRWRQKDGSGNAVSTVALPVTDEVNVVANPSFTVPTLAEATEVRFQLQLDGAGKKLDGSAHGDASLRLGLYSPVSEARFTILALAPMGVAVVSKPVDGGDTYKGGEKIEVAVTFGDRVLVDTSLGTPTLGLTVGTETRQATYVRGTGSNRLVFEYTVQSGDTGSDGIAIAANGLAPGGGAIASVYGVRAILDHAALAAQTGHKVGGSDDALTGGICERTPQVRDELLERVKANDDNVTDCSLVTTTHLEALTGDLGLSDKGIATLKRGDFAHLGGIVRMNLTENDGLTALPAGVFEGLDDTLTHLFLQGSALQSIAPGVFDGLTGLSLIINLRNNNLSSLPPRIFEKLTGLTGLSLSDNPGSARFAPIAKAGPAGGIEVVSGGSVTLGVEGAENGHDDPWGTNVTWAWSRTGGTGGSLTDAAAARATFTAPVTGEDGTHVFRLAVTGSDVYTATADIAVRVAAGPKAVEAAFAPDGGTGYAAGETIEVDLRFDRAVNVDTTGGTPSVTLTVGAAPRTAGYLRGSGTGALTFGYTVQAADVDADGVDLVANSLALNGGKIASVSDGGLAALGHAALAGGSGRTVNSPTAGGICDRTAAVQTAILERVRADENDASLQCGDIGPVRLVAIGGRLDLSAQARNGRMTALKAGDFAWLANVTVLDLDNHALRSFPAGIFDPLTALSELSIAYNQTQAADRLTSLPPGLFDRLTKLTTLRLEHNDLETLPDGIFEKLTRLTTLTLHGNPGSAAFLPVAAAGPAGGLEAETGERVTLGGDAGGPWGGNVVHAWRQVSGTAVALSATDAAKPAFAAPALAGPEDLAFELTVTGRGTSLTATDRVSVRIAAAAAVSSVVPASTPIDGDTYRRGETIGIAVGFAKPVTVTGTPQLALSVGTNTRQAAYVRGSGTGQLVFEYTVVQADADSDGIAIAADSLAPGTGAIADATGMAALLGHPALAAQAAHRVDGSLTHAFNPMAGICGRTAPVRDALLLLVRARTGDTALGCAQVTEAHLGALSGTLILAHKGIGTLKPGDFANLGGIAALQLDNNDLQTIPAGVFDRLTGLTTLSLHDNRLPSLPDRIFEGLMKLTQLSLNGNPGSADFKPTAMAGPEGGIDVPQGGSVTLGVEVPENGYDDPWGTNVTYAWSRTEGTGGTLTDATAAQAVFTPPATDGTHAFRLTVTGGGGVAGTSTVSVHVGAAGVPPMPVSAVVNGPTLTLTYSKNLQAEPPPASDSGKGQVYLAVVSVPGVRRNIEPVPPSAVEVMGRQVILTFKPSIDPNRVVTLSYFPDNATAESRIRDRGGNLADGFAGLRVRNVLSEGPVVRDIAFAGAAKTYGIGDTVGIDVTFSDPVAVTVTGGAPTLALEIGSANRKARWKAGQAAGAVQRFEYTVAEGEEDTDGIAVKADGLAVPSGSAIVTTAEREAVILSHGRVHDPAHKVDGVRPTVPPSQTVPGDARATAASISSSPSSGSTYRAGETVTVRLAMNEAVLVSGRPHILLDVGGVRRRAVYAGPIGSSTDVLDFSYTVQAGDLDTDGVGLCGAGRRPGCGSIDLNGGSIRAAGDESAARLGHPALAAQSGHKVDAAPLPALSTACADEIRVRTDWALKPSSVSAGGTFRLLFVGSVDRNAQSSNIADYNRFVQSLAAAGHSSIRPFKGGFRAVGSTAAVDARDNTCTTGTGVPIHWLNGNQVADNYADFYDNSWDDQANPKTESGNAIGPRNVWTGSNSDGTNGGQPLGNTPGGGRLIRRGTIGQSGGGGSPLSAASALASSSGSALAFYGLSQVFKVPAASDKARTTDIAIISSPAIGDAYRLGETVEVEVMYSEAVTVRGAPLVGLSVKNATGNDDNEYDAAYVRGSGTTKLVFSFTVPSGLRDDDGIQLYSSPLRLNGATITAVSDGDPAVWNLAAERNIGGKVDSSRTPSGGICSRTPQVRDAIVAAVAAASDCSQVTNAYLTALTGTLEFSGLTSIAAGDLAGLSSLTRLNLYGSGIETLPVGLFDGLGSLTRLDVRVGLTHLPKDIFRGLGKVTFLSLDGLEYPESPGNRLREGGLPDGIFEPLSRDVKEFWIFGSPGSESFRPRAADAGPGGTLSAGQKVTLGGPGNDGGPWGSNVFYRWRQKDGSGNAVSTVALPVTDEVNVVANPSFTVPTLAEATEVRFQLQLDGAGKKLDGGAHGDASLRLGLYSPVSEARFTIRGLAPTAVAVVSKPVDGGDTYKGGEKIEVAVTFGDRVLVDTSGGTPALGLAVGTETRQADYVRGTGSNRLVFEYTVQSGDTGSDGIAIAANGLAPGGGAIASVYGVRAILDHAALAAQTGHKVDGSLTHGFDLTGGVCGRTPQVRDKLLERVKANDSNVSTCSDVTTTHLEALTGFLDLDIKGIAVLKRGDFANLGGIAGLTLEDNDLTVLPAGVFEGLDDTLTYLYLHDNDLQTIAPGVFDGLTGPALAINLQRNNLSSLPPRIFEKLAGLEGLNLNDNPGSARFVPTAKAGPAGGIEVVSGGSVTLGVEGAENGHDDPWGTNVTWAWSRTGGASGTLTDAAAARAAFTAPVTGEDGTHAFRLVVTGKVNIAATADVAVRVAAGPKAVEAAFAPVGGSAYAGGETIEVALHFDRAVTVDIAGGTPSVTLTVGAAPRTAGYLRGSDTRVLAFGYTVQAADVDADGVDLVANSLALNGGKIAAVSDGGLAALGHAALAGGSGRTVNSPTAGGICDRTAAVQTAILARVRADENDASLQCGDVGPVRLVAIGGRLDLSAQARNGRMTALKAGDFVWLANVTVLDLDNHALRSFPAGIFDPLTALSELSIAYNQTQAADRLTSLPAGLFDRLTRLTTLRLEHNDLETLPDGIFEKLTRLTTLTLHGNPGSAAFLPVAAAGPAGGLEAETGERVTLGEDAGGPWGGNVVHAWRQVSGTAVALSATDAARPGFTAPALAGPEDLAFELTVTGRGTSLTATDRVSVRIAAAAAVSSVVPASTPIDGDTYRRGETIGIAVGFAKPVTVTGTPQLALSMGTNTRQAAYVRGSGTGQLVFEYTVVQADADSDGIAIAADSLAPGTGAIADATGMAALLGHPALAAQAAHRVDGSLTHAFNPMAGICGRTAPVRDALLLSVRARTGDTALGCAQVTTTHLGALSGTLILAGRGIGTLKPGDFANLGGIASVNLSSNELTSLPAGVFEGLDDTLTVLRLHGNGLLSLPSRIFENLTGLTTLSLHGNPGSARFVPVARAGPKGGIEVVQGASVTLGAADAAAGYDDPWGSNVTHSWSQTAGASQGAGNWTTARPSFTAPAADETLTFTLTVTGRGGIAATSTVEVRVGAVGVQPMPESAVVNGATLTLTYGEDLQETAPAPASGKGPVYLAVLSEPGVRRNIETVRPSAVEVEGRQVKLTLHRPVGHNEVVTLSYYPANAVAASRIRDRGGNLAEGFAGLEVRNDTPESPTVTSIERQTPSSSTTNANSLTWRVTFSENVQNVDAADFEVAGTDEPLTVTPVKDSSSQYDVTVSGGDLADLNATVTLTLAASPSIADTANNALTNTTPTGTNDNTYEVDNTAPTVTSIERQDPTALPTNEDSLTWRVTFDEDVQNVDAADFAVTGTTAGLTVEAVTDSSTQYDVKAEGNDLANLNATVTLGFATNPTIADTANNALTNTTPTGTNDNTYEVDNTAPTVTSIERQDPTALPTNEDSLTWRVTFDEDVQNVDAADFEVSGTAATVTDVTEATVSTVYDVTVSGNNLADLNATVTLGFATNPTIADTANNALTNTTPTGTNDNTYEVDNTAPTVTITGVPEMSTAAFPATFTFSEPVNNFVLGDITVGNGTASDFTGTDGDMVYTATVTPGADGTVTVDVAANKAMDAAGNNNTAATQVSSTYTALVTDNTAPTVTSIERQDPTALPTNEDSLTWRVTFDEDVQNVDAADFAVTGTTAGLTVEAVTDSSTQYDVKAEGNDLANLNATVTLGFATNPTIADTANNALTNTTPTGTNDNTYEVDNTAPTVTSIERQDPTALPTNEDSLTWRVTFDEDVQNVDAADFEVSGTAATVTDVTEATVSTVYDVTVSGNNLADLNATVTLGFATNPTIADTANNALTNTTPTGTNDNTYEVDNTAPTVTITGVPEMSTAAFPATFTFSEPVNNFVLGDITVGNGTASDFTGTDGDMVYTATVTPGADGTVTVDVAANKAMDAAGNNNTAATQVSSTYTALVTDNTAPTVTSIERQDPTALPTNEDSLTWRVTFDEDVQNVDAADFAVTGTTAGLTVEAVTDSSTQYDVKAEGNDLANLNATVTLGFATNPTIADTANNALTNTTPTGTNDNTYEVDNTAPTVTSIERQDPTALPTNEDSLTWRVTFDEDVQNVDAADFAVTGTTAGLTVEAVTDSSTQYDVKAEGNDLANLNATVTLGFATNPTIADTANNALTNTTPTGTNDNTYEVDNTAPTVTSIERQDPTALPTNEDSLTWRVTFDEDVQNVDAADFEVSGTAATVTDVTEATVSTVYDVTVSGNNLADLNATVTLGFATNPTIADTANNALTNTTPTGTNDNTYEVDNTAPTVTITGVPEMSTAAFPATFTFSEPVNNFVLGDITVGNGTASDFTGTDGDMVYTATVTPGADGTVTVDVAANKAMDAAGNNNTAATQVSSTYTALVTDTTAPELVTAQVDGETLTLTYNEALDTGSAPAPGDFSVSVAGQTAPVSGVALSGSALTLTLAVAVVNRDSVTVTYTPGSNPIQDLAGNDAAAILFPVRVVDNVTVSPPGAPGRLAAIAGNGQVSLGWAAPSVTGGAAIVGYAYRVSPDGGNSWSPDWSAVPDGPDTGNAAADERAYLVTGLANGTAYTFQVRASNNTHSGPAAQDEATPQTGPAADSGRPARGLQARAGDAAVTLSWQAPLDTGNRPLLRYEARHAQGSTVPSSVSWQDVGGVNVLTYTVTGLTNGRQHTFEVRALNTAALAGAPARVQATPEVNADTPSMVRNLRVVVEAVAVRLYWHTPTREGLTAITHYEYRYARARSVPAGATWVRLADYTGTGVRLLDLDTGVEYTFEVRAVNATGPGARAQVRATPGEPALRAPGAPDNLRAVAGEPYLARGNGIEVVARQAYVNVTLSWDPPTSDGNSRIWGYETREAEGGSIPAGAPWRAVEGELTATVRALTPGTRYTFEVRALTDVGPGPAASRRLTTVRYRGPTVTLRISGAAREGEPFTLRATRSGATDPDTYVFFELHDSAFPAGNEHHVAYFHEVAYFDGTTATASYTPPFDTARPARRTFTVRISEVNREYDISGDTVTVSVSDRDAGLRVADDSVREGAGATLAFVVRLDRARDRDIGVDYATSAGTATAGMDYTDVSGRLVIPAGSRSATIEVAVLDDDIDDDRETLTLTLSNADGAVIDDGVATGTIRNTDALPKAWLSRFGRSAAVQVVTLLDERFEAAAAGDVRLVLGGRAVDVAALRTPGSGEPARRERPAAGCSTEAGTGTPQDCGAADRAPLLNSAGAGPGRPAEHVVRLDDQAGTFGQPGADMSAAPGEQAEPAGEATLLERALWTLLTSRGRVQFDTRQFISQSSFDMSLENLGGGGPSAEPAQDCDECGVMQAPTFDGRWSLWGRGALMQFSGQDNSVNVSGDVLTGLLGVDYARDRWLAGAALAYHDGDGSYTSTRNGGTGALDSVLVTVNPYLRYALTPRLSVWGTLGYGAGALTLRQSGGPAAGGQDADAVIETDLRMGMGALGLRGVVYAGEHTEWALKSDALWVRTSSAETAGLRSAGADTSRLRLLLSGQHQRALAHGALLSPGVELGLRYDDGDAETGFGLELGGGLRYADSVRGLTVETKARALLAHEDGAYEEWGLSGSLALDPGRLGRGLALRLDSGWGVADSGAEALWQRQTTAGIAPQHDSAAQQRITAEMGYGLDVPWTAGILTPYSGVEWAGSGRTLRLGWRFVLGRRLSLSLDGERTETGHTPPEHTLMLRTSLPW